MGRLIAAIIICLLSLSASIAQDTAHTIAPHRSIAGDYTDFSADDIGNIYLVSNKASIKKLNDHFDSVAMYNGKKRYGNINAVDASNPLKILVFYKEAAIIVILDQMLNERQVVDLRKNNIRQPAAIRVSYDNNTWVFDEFDNKIKKIDDAGKLLMQTDDLRSIDGQAYSFSTIIAANKSLYCYDPQQGLFVFDQYGAFIKKYPFTGWKDIQVVNGAMVGRAGNDIVMAHEGDFGFKTTGNSIPLNGAIKLVYIPRYACILYPGKLEIYDAP